MVEVVVCQLRKSEGKELRLEVKGHCCQSKWQDCLKVSQ